MASNSPDISKSKKRPFDYDPSLCSRAKPLPQEYQNKYRLERSHKRRRRDDDHYLAESSRRKSRHAQALDMNRRKHMEEFLVLPSSYGRGFTSSMSSSFETNSEPDNFGKMNQDVYMNPSPDTVLTPRFEPLPGCSKAVEPRNQDSAFEEFPDWVDCMGQSAFHDPIYDQFIEYNLNMDSGVFASSEPRPGCSKDPDPGYQSFEPIPGTSKDSGMFQKKPRHRFDDFEDDDDDCFGNTF